MTPWLLVCDESSKGVVARRHAGDAERPILAHERVGVGNPGPPFRDAT
jgi:hypothetical protein